MPTNAHIPLQRIYAWCQLCGRVLNAESQTARKVLAKSNGFEYSAAICRACEGRHKVSLHLPEGAFSLLMPLAEEWVKRIRRRDNDA